MQILTYTFCNHTHTQIQAQGSQHMRPPPHTNHPWRRRTSVEHLQSSVEHLQRTSVEHLPPPPSPARGGGRGRGGGQIARHFYVRLHSLWVVARFHSWYVCVCVCHVSRMMP
jgi:hypothetical protein